MFNEHHCLRGFRETFKEVLGARILLENTYMDVIKITKQDNKNESVEIFKLFLELKIDKALAK